MMPDTRVGMTFGHEFIGVVEQVGPSVQSLAVGDRVMVPFNVYCGSCYFCARGRQPQRHRRRGGIYGYSHICGGYDGGQAEFVRVGAGRVSGVRPCCSLGCSSYWLPH
jgi:threonine dehydrogenase-like Zn-dependent dehydrogenase